jgi:hypothetical protein
MFLLHFGKDLDQHFCLPFFHACLLQGFVCFMGVHHRQCHPCAP